MIQFSDKIEILLEEFETEDRELSSVEKVIVNVVEAASLIDEEGLHSFWHSGFNENLVIKSFDAIGAFEIIDLIQSSQWVKSAADDRGDLSDTEESHLSDIESELLPLLEDLSDLIEEYLEE
jgi:hypothetical protein